jgi:RNAse (barnase) inhibitor barstar
METDNRIHILKINASKILSWNTFHSYFQKIFGFLDFYGRNMNAWIDCMGDLDKPEHGMTTNFSIRKGEYLVIRLVNVDELKVKAHDIYIALLECSAHINNGRISNGEPPLIFLAF